MKLQNSNLYKILLLSLTVFLSNIPKVWALGPLNLGTSLPVLDLTINPIPPGLTVLPPTNVAITVNSDTSLTVEWTDNSIYETDFKLIRKKDDRFLSTITIPSSDTSGTGRLYSRRFNNLSEGRYCYWLTANAFNVPSPRTGIVCAWLPLPRPLVFDWEVNQGLVEYEQVAGKDTLVRVFVGTPDASEPSTLDYASLNVSGPEDINFDIKCDMTTGVFTNTRKTFDERENVNCFLPGNQLSRVGTYHFSVKFYRAGQMIRNFYLGTENFFDTKDLLLLIVVDKWPMPTMAWNALFNALQYVNRNFPIRSGVGPMDGDDTIGLRYAVDPRPFDPDFFAEFGPKWEPVRKRLNEFNRRQQTLGRFDRADHVITVTTQQPGAPNLAGSGQGGPGGVISGVVLNVSARSQNLPAWIDVFGTLISQEIGHNFLIGDDTHSPDSNIVTRSAFNLLDRQTIAQPRSIMFQTYSSNTNQQSFFLPEDWSTIREGLLTKDSTGPD